MDDREFLQPILESYGIFKPLRTIPIFSFQLIASLAIEITAVVFAALHPQEAAKCREYFILIYAHVGLWFLTLILDQIARAKHYSLRMNGYLDFYKKTQVHHRLPLYIVSLWNAVILLLQALMQHFYPDNFAEKCLEGGLLSPINYFCALMTFEFCLIFGVNINYILRVNTFNNQKPPPDVQREEWNACSSDQAFSQGEIGYRQLGDKMYDFIEKQADMIRHLKDHNARLGEKLMVLNAQLQARTSSGN
ncbi:PREDICTED: transmembrane protein 192 isoform X2 [Nicrophorus vespilloides]|nr:PREDICTED: transmembrane protein 192 isoform X2 [Nicrophorus vespilloides]